MTRNRFQIAPASHWLAPIGSTLRAYRPTERRRRRVVDAALLVLTLMQDLQQHRGLSCAMLTGQRNFRDDCEAVGEKLQRSLAAVSEPTVDGHDLLASAPWQRVLASWESLHNGWRELDFHTNLSVHSALILDLVGVLGELAAIHGEVLGDRRRVVAEWPQMVEHLGMLRALGLRLVGTRDARDDATTCGAFNLHLHEARSTLAEAEDLIQALPLYTLSETAIERAIALRTQPDQTDPHGYHAALTHVIDAWFVAIRAQLREPG